MEGPVWEPRRSELRVVRRRRDEASLGGSRDGSGPQRRERSPRGDCAGVRTAKNGGAAPAVAGLVFFLHANAGTPGTAIPACVPGAPQYAAAGGGYAPRGHAGRASAWLEAGEGCRGGSAGLRAAAVANAHEPASPFPGRASTGRRGLSRGAPQGVWEPRGDCEAGGGAVQRPSAPSEKTGVTWGPGVRDSDFSQSGARYSGVGGKKDTNLASRQNPWECPTLVSPRGRVARNVLCFR